MPTVLDAFVIELGLDPTKFTQGQQKLFQQLGQIQQRAQQAGKAVEGSVTNTLHRFYALLRNPLEEGIRNLDRIGSQARRSGNAIAAGAGAGATALAALGAAGLGAYAAIKSVQSLLKDVVQNVDQAAQLGRVAPLIGTTTEYASQFAQAAYVNQNVPFEASTGFLYNLQQNIQQLEQFGQYGNLFEKLTRLGINVGNQQNPTSIPDLVSQISKHIQGMTGPQAAAWLSQLGITDPGLVQFFRQGPNALNQQIQAQQATAVTEQQAKAAQELQRAYNAATIAIDSLYRKLLTDLAPALTQVIGQFDKWILDLQSDPQKMKSFEDQINEIGGDIKSAFMEVKQLVDILSQLYDIMNKLGNVKSFSETFKLLGKLFNLINFGPGQGANPQDQQPGDFLPETGAPPKQGMRAGPGTKGETVFQSIWHWLHDQLGLGTGDNNEGAQLESILPFAQETSHSAQSAAQSAKDAAESAHESKVSIDDTKTWWQQALDYLNQVLGSKTTTTDQNNTQNAATVGQLNQPVIRTPTIPEQERISRAMNFFQSKGLSFTQAAGIVGRLYAESKLDPNSINPQSGAYGIAQWLGSRKPAAIGTEGDLNRQLQLVWDEFNSTENKAFRDIKSSTTIPQVAAGMEEYERAGDPAFTDYSARVAQRIEDLKASIQTDKLANHIAGLKTVQQAQAANHTLTTNHYYDNDANVGAVNVQVANNGPGNVDGYAVGGAAADAIKRSMLVNQANTALESVIIFVAISAFSFGLALIA